MTVLFRLKNSSEFFPVKDFSLHKKEKVEDIRATKKLDQKTLESLLEYVKSGRVQTLDLSNIALDDEGAEYVSTAIRVNALNKKSLTWVNLSQNKISDNGAEALAAAIHDAPDVSIRLNDNKIGSKGALALVQDIAKGNREHLVDLSGNLIDDDGAGEISKSLASNLGEIRHLNLTGNLIKMRGDRLMAKHLPLDVEVAYRTEEITFTEYSKRHPCVSMLGFIFLTPIWIIAALFMNRIQEPIQGLLNPRTGPKMF